MKTPEPTPARPIPQELLATLQRRPNRLHVVMLIAFGLATLAGVVAYAHQLRAGLAATAMNDYFSWGIYIINFVFFIGISMAGSLISAVLRLTGVPWRHPITRLAEIVTVVALLIAGAMIVADMGRPDRFYFLFLHGRWQSPILWDVLSLTTYLTGSVIFLYASCVPDLALLRDQGNLFAPWRQRLYHVLALGWRGTPAQCERLRRATATMAIVIIPVAVSIHTVTAWLFGMTLRPGWHSTIIGPDFVVGALYSGVAAVVTLMWIIRQTFRLEAYLWPDHFRRLGWLLVVLCAAYAYFIVNEHMAPGYTGGEASEEKLLFSLFHGAYAVKFWTMIGIGLVLPGALLLLPFTRNVTGIVAASVLINIGMWLKRYIIVVPTLSSPLLPVDLTPLTLSSPTAPALTMPSALASVTHVAGKTIAYVPTITEWAITAGAFGGFALLYYAFARLVPIITIDEGEGDVVHSAQTSGEGGRA